MKLHEERIFAICNILNKYNVESVLDCGCGNGRLLKKLLSMSNFKKLAGVDYSQKRLKIAKKNTQNSTVKLYYQSFFDVNVDFFQYEAFVASEIIEHLSSEELNMFFEKILKRIKPKLLIITTPNKSYNMNYEILYNGLRHKSHVFEFDEQELNDYLIILRKSYPYYIIEKGYCDSNHASHLIIFERKY